MNAIAKGVLWSLKRASAGMSRFLGGGPKEGEWTVGMILAALLVTIPVGGIGVAGLGGAFGVSGLVLVIAVVIVFGFVGKGIGTQLDRAKPKAGAPDLPKAAPPPGFIQG